MGAADVVPGVSGGTIAFITGIYGELLDSIKSINLQAVKLLFTGKFGAFWKKVNGNFLFAVVCGIGLSIFSLARLMTYLLAHHPTEIWSLFFGLIIASSLLVSKEVARWNTATIIALAAGAAAAFLITILSPANTPQTGWFVLLSGAIAICAMILPGISGAFILLLLGQYEYLMRAVGELNIPVIGLFAVGAIAGIISFSHLLSWLLKNFHAVTVATLTGFMIGSLNKVWPWKEPLETYIDRHGVEKAITERNILPDTFDTGVWTALLMCLCGFLLIWGIEYAAGRIKKNA